MAAVDTSLHQQAGGDSRVPPRWPEGVGRAVLILPVPLGVPSPTVPWHTAPCRAGGCAPVGQQFSGDIPLCGQETAPVMLPWIHPSGCVKPPGQGLWPCQHHT